MVEMIMVIMMLIMMTKMTTKHSNIMTFEKVFKLGQPTSRGLFAFVQDGNTTLLEFEMCNDELNWECSMCNVMCNDEGVNQHEMDEAPRC